MLSCEENSEQFRNSPRSINEYARKDIISCDNLHFLRITDSVSTKPAAAITVYLFQVAIRKGRDVVPASSRRGRKGSFVKAVVAASLTTFSSQIFRSLNAIYLLS